MRVIEGELRAEGKRFALIVSRFNELISKKLLEGAIDCLKRHGTEEDNITIVWTPGSFEIPYIANILAQKKEYDALICLGAVIKGDTPHFNYIANEVSKGIAKISMEKGIPVIFGVLTTDNLEQALERAGAKAGNRGFQAALSAIELVNLTKKVVSSR